MGQGAEGEADPWDNDGPTLYTTMAIDALLERCKLQNFVYRKLAGLFDFAANGNGPRRSLEVRSILGGLIFIDAKLIEIVVVGDVSKGIDLFVSAKWPFYGGELGGGEDIARGRGEIVETFASERGKT